MRTTTTYSNIVTQLESEYETVRASQDESEIREPPLRGSYSTRDESAVIHEADMSHRIYYSPR